MKFRYYITDTFNGAIKGTNDEKKASEFAACQEFFVLDTLTGIWITDEGPQEIEEVK